MSNPMRLRVVIAVAAGVLAVSPGAGHSVAQAEKGGAVLGPGEVLKPGATLFSRGDRYRLTQQRDGNLVLLDRRTPTWSSQTAGRPGARAVMRRNGNLVVRGRDGSVLFASGTTGNRSAFLRVQPDGNAVVYAKNGRRALWSSVEDRWLLRDGQFLRAGQSRRSPDGRFVLTQQPDGNLVLYDWPLRAAEWSAQTTGNPGAVTRMRNGELVVVSPGGQVLYGTGTAGHRGASLNVQTDGNAVIYTGARHALWSSEMDTHRLNPGQALRAGQWRESIDGRFRLQMQPDGNLVLVSLPQGEPMWSTATAGHAGAFAALSHQGNLVVWSASGQPLWQTATTTPGAALEVQTDGNVVLYAPDRSPLWSSMGG